MDNKTNKEEELLKIFIGNNYEKITTKKFNFAGLFFSFIYMFYRKMIGYGLTVSFIYTLLIVLIRFKTITTTYIIQFVITLVTGIIVGIFVNKIYIDYAKKKIKTLKELYPEKNFDELKQLCAEKGGTSIGLIFLGLFIVVVFAFFVGFLTGIFRSSNNSNKPISEDTTYIDEEYENYLKDAKNGRYNGMLAYDTNIDIKNIFTLTIPDKFNNNLIDNTYEYVYEYENNETEEIFNKCIIQFSALEGYNNASLLISSMHTFYIDDKPSKITNSSINGISWNSFSYSNDIGKKYYYATTKNNRVFLLEYEIDVGADSKCEEYLKPIIDSIRNK